MNPGQTYRTTQATGTSPGGLMQVLEHDPAEPALQIIQGGWGLVPAILSFPQINRQTPAPSWVRVLFCLRHHFLR